MAELELQIFKNIRDKVSAIPCRPNELNHIKDNFQLEINSARRFDRIISLDGLIRILEKRDVLNLKNIKPLQFIASILQRNDLIQLINPGDETINLQNQAVHNQVIQNQLASVEPVQGRVLPKVSLDPIKRVDDMICNDIGQKWNELARKLDIPEGYIDELEHKYKRISDMVQEILIYYREKEDERYWKIKLCNALQDARRKDLSMKVAEVFASYQLM